MLNKRGQVTIFIIIALVIIGSVGGYFILKETVFKPVAIPPSMEPVYNAFITCVQEDTSVGINILESQGGYIELPEFESGSGYMPFSSQLVFLGNPIPYWYYVSGNNIQKEQIPSKSLMEDHLGEYIEKEIRDCLVTSFYEKGFDISMGEPKAKVSIQDEEVRIDLDMDLSIEKANESIVVSNHEVIFKSKLGKLYDSARKIYEYEQDTLFLENYGVDTLRLYAPVDGVELTCSPLIWSADSVFDDLESAIEANTQAIKVKSGDFSLTEKDNKYFIVDLPVEENVRFLNSVKWPHGFEVNPDDDGILISKPVGTQPGMSALGFCYVPYHFVYDVKYPVLVQVYSGNEIFQFPLAVVILGNKPREALDSVAIEAPNPELCEYKNTEIMVNTYDMNVNPVVANISYQCFSQTCLIGETTNGILEGFFPQCVNGFIIATAEGYEREKYYVESTTQENSVDIILNKVYDMQIQLKINGKPYSGDAIITFNSEKISRTIIYPGQREIKLSSGQWEIQAHVYKNTSLKIPKTTQEECMDIPKSGLGSIFGVTEEKCFDISIPAQTIDNSLYAGGVQEHYILESDLESSTIIDISASSLPVVKKIEDLQQNYILFEDKGLDIDFR